jgi:hypothetical protein
MMMMEVDLHAPGTLHALSVGIFLGIVVTARQGKKRKKKKENSFAFI